MTYMYIFYLQELKELLDGGGIWQMEVAYGRYASIFTIHDLKALTLHLKSFSPNLNSDFLY